MSGERWVSRMRFSLGFLQSSQPMQMRLNEGEQQPRTYAMPDP